jgi:ATP-dependent Lhr-like helicase
VAARKTRLVEVETPTASPFARSLLFRYIGAFMYEGDAPLAERRAQALALDSALLAELLGQSDLRELLDPEVIAQAAEELQRRTPDRHATDLEGVADLLRLLGPLTTNEVATRCTPPPLPPASATPAPTPTPEPPAPSAEPAAARWLAELEASRRAIRVRIGGIEHWAAIEDAGRLRDALGIPLPVGVPDAFLEPVDDPLGDLVSRYARTHTPFPVAAPAARFGLGSAVVNETLHRLAAAGRVVEGEFLPFPTADSPRTDGASAAVDAAHTPPTEQARADYIVARPASTEWCDAGVLRMLRRRSLARLRAEVEPSPPEALARFLPTWHGIGSSRLRGMDALVQAIDQLQGAAVPASALESLILPARVPDYSPAMLDELTAAGEVIWAGQGALPGGDGWMSLYLADTAPLLMPDPSQITLTPLHEQILDALAGGGAVFFRNLADRINSPNLQTPSARITDQDLVTALWDLVWAGHLTNDTLAPLRAALGAGRPAHRTRTARRGRPVLPSRTGPPTAAGRWWLLPEREPDRTRRSHALAEVLLERYGIVLRGAVAAEHAPGGFAAVYPVLKAFEESGRCRRGYFVEGLGAAQFALPGAVDRLRSLRGPPPATSPPHPDPSTQPSTAPGEPGEFGRSSTERAPRALVLAAADPVNPYGAALSWPGRDDEAVSGHKPGRKAGALVVLVDGSLVLYVERGGRTLLSWTDDHQSLQPAVDALALAVREGALGKLTVERADGEAINDSPLGTALEAAGFHPTPRGLRLRA